jgi:choline dehydrogenase
VQAAVNYGLPRNPDYNGKVQEGAGFLQFTIRNGRRHSTAAAFLEKARNRPNLKIETDAHVQRIDFEGRCATGVAYMLDGTPRQTKAAREVILSAGALDSPKMLMLSGIGPGAHLQEHGIEVLADLPGVGRNLQDHFHVNMTFRAIEGASANPQLRGWRAYWNGAKYIVNRRGLLAIGASEACVFYRGLANATTPDIQAHFRPVSWEFSPAGVLQIGRGPELTSSFTYLRPQSRGWVTLKSTDPNEGVSIRCNYFDAQPDREAVAAGINLMRGIHGTKPLRSLIVEELAPGPDVLTEAEMIDFARNTVQTMHHWSCTCAMGNDEMAVVDDQLRVRGIQGLRVVDTSVFPRLTSGNTNAPTIMVAEKAADLVKASARN